MELISQWRPSASPGAFGQHTRKCGKTKLGRKKVIVSIRYDGARARKIGGAAFCRHATVAAHNIYSLQRLLRSCDELNVFS